MRRSSHQEQPGVFSFDSKSEKPLLTYLISIVIPIRNEANHISRVLDDLLTQNYPVDQFEVLVVDGLSTDKTVDVVRPYTEKHPNIRLFTNPKRLSSAARNIGVQNARGSVILIVDGHCFIENREMLANVNQMLQNPEIHGLGRPQSLFLDNANLIQKAIAMARDSKVGHHPDSFIYSDKPQKVPAISVAIAYRREVFGQIGLFDERFDACEDCELNHRFDEAGFHCYFTPNIAVNYLPRASLSGLWKQLARYGRGRIRLARKHPSAISLKAFLPALLLLGFVLGGVLSFCSQYVMIVYLTIACLYLMIVVAESMRLSIVNRFYCGIFLLPLVFATIHFSAGCGEWTEILFGPKMGKQ